MPVIVRNKYFIEILRTEYDSATEFYLYSSAQEFLELWFFMQNFSKNLQFYLHITWMKVEGNASGQKGPDIIVLKYARPGSYKLGWIGGLI